MNAERLNNVLHDITAEVDEHSILSILQSFESMFIQNISQPNQQNADTFIQTRDVLNQALNKCRSNHFPPSQRTIVESIGGASFVGTGLMVALDQIIEDNIATPGQAITEVQKHVQGATDFFTTVQNTSTNFESLNIVCDYTQKDEYEFGVLLPADLFKNNLEGLTKEISSINRHLKTFGELAGADTASPTLRSVSSGSMEFFLNLIPEAADWISVAIERIVGLYLMVLLIRKNRSELKQNKVPKKALEPLEEYEKKYAIVEIEKIADDLFNKYKKKQDKPREKELRSLLVDALKYLASRIDQGANFEVTPPSEFEEPGESATEKEKTEHKQKVSDAKQLGDRSAKIKELPERKQPILSLPEPREEKEDPPTNESSTTS